MFRGRSSRLLFRVVELPSSRLKKLDYSCRLLSNLDYSSENSITLSNHPFSITLPKTRLLCRITPFRLLFRKLDYFVDYPNFDYSSEKLDYSSITQISITLPKTRLLCRLPKFRLLFRNSITLSITQTSITPPKLSITLEVNFDYSEEQSRRPTSGYTAFP